MTGHRTADGRADRALAMFEPDAESMAEDERAVAVNAEAALEELGGFVADRLQDGVDEHHERQGVALGERRLIRRLLLDELGGILGHGKLQ